MQATPRKLPAAGQLFQVEILSSYGEGDWLTVAWTLTRMDADDVAEMRLAKHEESNKRVRIWFEGRIVAVYDVKCHPGTGRPGVTVEQIAGYLHDTGWARQAGRSWVKDTERITLPHDDVDKPRVAKAVADVGMSEGRSFGSIKLAIEASMSAGAR